MIDRRVENKYSGGYRLDRLVEQMRVWRILEGGVVGGEGDNSGTGLEEGEDGLDAGEDGFLGVCLILDERTIEARSLHDLSDRTIEARTSAFSDGTMAPKEHNRLLPQTPYCVSTPFLSVP